MDENRLVTQRGEDGLWGWIERQDMSTEYLIDIVPHSPFSRFVTIRVRLAHKGPQWKATMPWAEFAEMMHRALAKHPKAERIG